MLPIVQIIEVTQNFVRQIVMMLLIFQLHEPAKSFLNFLIQSLLLCPASTKSAVILVGEHTCCSASS